jgi:hypothetical protein
MKFIGSKIKKICHNLLYLHILLVILQVSVLHADTSIQFNYIGSGAEYSTTVNGARPRGITATKDYVFLADAGRNAIAIYKNDNSGKLLLLHKGQSTVDGVISYPYDIAYNESTKLLVLLDQFSTFTRFAVYEFIVNDSDSNTVELKFKFQHTIRSKFAGIAINDSGNTIYALNSDGTGVSILSINASDLSETKVKFEAAISANSFAGIDYYNDGSKEYLAVSNPIAKQVILYQISASTFVLEKTLPTASSNIKLGQPTDVDIWTTDTGKAFYVVTDRASSCVDIFDFSTDEFVIQFGNTGSTTAKVDFPYCSAGVDGTSTIFIADSNNRRIAAYNVSVDSPNDDNTDDKPVGSSEVEIKFTSISMTNLVVSLSGVDPMGYYMLDCKEKLTDTWVSTAHASHQTQQDSTML